MLNDRMRIRSGTLALILLAACAPVSGSPTSVPPQGGTTTSPTTTVPATTTSVVADDLVTSSCPTDAEGFRILCESVDLIEQHYVDPVDDTALASAAIAGLDELGPTGTATGTLTCAMPLQSFLSVCQHMEARHVGADGVESLLFGIAEHALDPNSAYLTPSALSLLSEEQSGTVEGIGAFVTTEDLTSDDPTNTTCSIISETCPLVVVSTLAGSPAAAAGVQPDDRFLAVDGAPTDGSTIDEVTAEVRGPAGSDVTITFGRGDQTIDITITRAAVDIPVTQHESFGDVGYLRLNLFTGNAGEQFRADLADLLDQGAGTIVLDLRDDPGGALDAALDVASEFLPDGLVLRTTGPEGERSYPVRDEGVARDPDLTILVLVNRGSASASEVVAGALQERGRATIIGETTFGKNTVQQRFGLSNGGAMKLTIARWMTPGGVDFDNGITPDRPMDIPADLSPEEIVALVTR